ncbi:hypothetical protein O8E88_000459 [Flavobacterium psychrophilum]|uniref:hypothetical protein n=1 Tax=Flavobacterium psychrophilum TaxID=96345 RepID=UPI0004F8D33E|nr:hypothetical protein [Flavobacterium psychrophilum]AIN74100.1 hypothetical protein FPG3_07080 [Flavobacterium psychrophilum FPG3]EKT2068677.1 hypothetical protein [Flavobacterium psychrophilum]EKT2072803.1 hypothetical protein [Flavobacterium psychrophilum]MBF2045129.1 hypothetical protein [Flavobacterium psychrophilum]OXB15481.1 hypothetical protein B0A57_00435 [Flavobacterium psychrophilum DSM 3660 = ATCC 49418]
MKLKILFISFLIILSCKNNSKSSTEDYDNNSTNYSAEDNRNVDYESDETTEIVDNEVSNNSNIETEKQIDDGNYDASVDYYNPKTGYSATYDLDVDVENGEVVRINFPKGGWLDEDVHPAESRLSPAELNEDGEATMEDENGRTFEVKIKN